MKEPIAIAKKIAALASERKAEDILILDIQGISLVADFFVICSTGSSTRIQAIARHIEEKLEEEKVELLRKEGFREAQWILLDYGSVVAHLFQEEYRRYYNLERLWGDAKYIPYEAKYF